MPDLIIHDGNWQDHVEPIVNGEKKVGGLVLRNFAEIPYGSMASAPPFSLPLIPRSEWADRLAAQKAAKASLVDIRNRGMNGQPIPSRDQNGYGYCWAHSSTSACLLARARDGQPYADLSAFAVACVIKNFRNQGGWGGESLEFIAERGIPTAEFWPQKSTQRSLANDPKVWENAKLHLAMEWEELDPHQMEDQFATCLFSNMPVVADYDYWRHSVCAAAIETLTGSGSNTRLDTGWIWNSWTDSWGTNGMGLLKGRRFIPSQAWVLRSVTASAA